METLLLYLAKAAALTGIFFLAYHLLLRKETFFLSNRRFLLAGLFTAAILPLLVFKRVLWVDPAVQAPVHTIDLNTLLKMQQMQQFIKQPETISVDWFDIMAGVYFAGLALFLIRLILDIMSIRKILKSNKIIKDGSFRLIDSNRVQSPFSFFNYIVVNSAILEQEELDSIICHEKVHSAQSHSIDMIVSQLFCAIFWFNPIAWLYKKSIAQNLEFIADAEAIKMLDNRTVYQKTLLKITMQPECIAITNHFYQSLIKKRIVMLNKQQSTQWNSWKYAMVIPALIAFVIMFQVKVVAQEKQPAISDYTQETTKVSVEITKDATDEQLTSETKVFKEQFDADVTFTDITRNSGSEITGLKVSVKDKTQSKVFQVSGTEPISPFNIEMEKGNGRTKIYIGSRNSDFALSADQIYYTDRIAADTLVFNRDEPIMAYSYGDGMVAPARPNFRMNGGADVMLSAGDELIVIDGVKQKKGEITLPNANQIASITVLKGKEGKKKYGRDAKKGVIEITTHKNGVGRFKITGPNTFSYAIPGNEGSFQIEIPDMNFEFPEFDGEIFIEGFEGFPDMTVFEGLGDFTFNITSDMSEDELRAMREQLENSRIQIEKSRPQMELQLRKQLQGEELQRATEEMRKELEEAKKEIEQARKELEKSKKEMQQKRTY